LAREHHHQIDPDAGDRRLFAVVAVNIGLTLAQVIGRILSRSLALIANTLYRISDTVSFINVHCSCRTQNLQKTA
jgi:cobalt-zinc-cadmium efflux system protein